MGKERRVTSPLPIRRNPAKYDQISKIILKDIDDRLDKILEKMDLKENETVLDYGCGDGSNCMSYLVPVAEKLNWTIYAVDNSDSMIKRALETNPHPKVSYVVGDVMDADFQLKEIKFDRIFSIHYTQFLLDDLKEILKELYKMLSDGGTLLLTTWYNEILESIYEDQIEHKEWSDTAKAHLSMLKSVSDAIKNPEEWKKALEDMNMNIKEISSTLDLTYKFETLTAVADAWFDHNLYALHLPEEEQKTLRGLYITKLQETETKYYTPTPGSEDKEYTVTYDRVDMLFIK